jgi:hypothetical protein
MLSHFLRIGIEVIENWEETQAIRNFRFASGALLVLLPVISGNRKFLKMQLVNF